MADQTGEQLPTMVNWSRVTAVKRRLGGVPCRNCGYLLLDEEALRSSDDNRWCLDKEGCDERQRLARRCATKTSEAL
jgi:hypothetical protein